jgi:hypothetical protein
VEYLQLPIALALAALAVYVLAILLRVSCHFCGVEIPTLGRALFATFTAAALSLLALWILQSLLVGENPRHIDLVLQFVSLVLALAAHLLITVALYVPLLGVRFGQAFTVWLMQAVVFIAFGFAIGCCAGVLSLT